MQRVQSTKINVAAVHDLEYARHGNRYVEHIDIVQFSVAAMDKIGVGHADIAEPAPAAQIETKNNCKLFYVYQCVTRR